MSFIHLHASHRQLPSHPFVLASSAPIGSFGPPYNHSHLQAPILPTNPPPPGFNMIHHSGSPYFVVPATNLPPSGPIYEVSPDPNMHILTTAAPAPCSCGACGSTKQQFNPNISFANDTNGSFNIVPFIPSFEQQQQEARLNSGSWPVYWAATNEPLGLREYEDPNYNNYMNQENPIDLALLEAEHEWNYEVETRIRLEAATRILTYDEDSDGAAEQGENNEASAGTDEQSDSSSSEESESCEQNVASRNENESATTITTRTMDTLADNFYSQAQIRTSTATQTDRWSDQVEELIREQNTESKETVEASTATDSLPTQDTNGSAPDYAENELATDEVSSGYATGSPGPSQSSSIDNFVTQNADLVDPVGFGSSGVENPSATYPMMIPQPGTIQHSQYPANRKIITLKTTNIFDSGMLYYSAHNRDVLPLVHNQWNQSQIDTLQSDETRYDYYVPPRVNDDDYFGGQLHIWATKFREYFSKFLPDTWILQGCPDLVHPNIGGPWYQQNITTKLRFCCRNCKRPWTSMRGKVGLYFNFDFAARRGFAYLKIFAQVCNQDHCISNGFQTPACYPEEINKVLHKLSQFVGYFYYYMPISDEIIRGADKAIRDGHPKSQHRQELCQACQTGVCSYGRTGEQRATQNLN